MGTPAINECVNQLIAEEEPNMCHTIAYALTLDDGLLKSSRGACSFFVCHSALNGKRGLQGKQAVLL